MMIILEDQIFFNVTILQFQLKIGFLWMEKMLILMILISQRMKLYQIAS